MIRGKISKFTKSRLVKESFAYTLINILDKTIPFILLPIITRILPKEEVGYYVLYQSIYQIFVPIVTLTLENSVILNFFRLKKEQFVDYFTSTVYLFLSFFAIILTTAWLANDWIYNLTELTPGTLPILFSILFFFFIVNMRTALWRNQHKVKIFGFFQVSLTLIKNSIGLVLIYFFNFGWHGIIAGHLIGLSVFSIIAIYFYSKDGFFVLVPKNFKLYIKDALKISVPLSLHKLAAWLGSSLNRVIIAKKIGANATASFGIGSTFYTVANVLYDAMNKAYVPALFEKLSNFNSTTQASIQRMIRFYYFIIIGVTLFLCVFGYFSVGLIFGEDYLSTRDFLIPLTLAAGLTGLYKIHVNFLFFEKKTFLILIISVSTAILNIPVAFYLIINHGLIGAAYALLAVNFIYYLLALLFSKKMRKNYFLRNT